MIHIAQYEGPGGLLIADDTARTTGLTIATTERGIADIRQSIRVPLTEAFRRYDAPGLPHVKVSNNGAVLAEARLEDPAITSEGMNLTAFGYSRALRDIPYTALWTASQPDMWEPTRETDSANRSPKMYTMDTQGRLFIGLTKNAVYGNGTGNSGALTFAAPDEGSRLIIGFSFLLSIDLPTNWNYRINGMNRDFSGFTTIFSGTWGIGAFDEPHFLTFAGYERLELQIYNNTGANYTMAGETGTKYIRMTNLRIVTTTTNKIDTTLTAGVVAGSNKTLTVGSTARMYIGQELIVGDGLTTGEIATVTSITDATHVVVATLLNAHSSAETVRAFVVYADEIVRDLITTTTIANPTQLSARTDLVRSPAVDLTDEVFEDAYPADILDHLITKGDTTAATWEWAVWEDRVVRFQPRGTSARTWLIDIDFEDLEVVRTLEALTNSAYAVYEDEESDSVLRTATNTDSASVARFGLTRRAPIPAETTNVTLAGGYRDATLALRKNPIPQARLTIKAVYDAQGGRWPLWVVRAGDTLTVRNLPPATSTSAIDRIRTFRIVRTELDVLANMLVVEPEAPLQTIDAQLARAAIRKPVISVTDRGRGVRDREA